MATKYDKSSFMTYPLQPSKKWVAEVYTIQRFIPIPRFGACVVGPKKITSVDHFKKMSTSL